MLLAATEGPEVALWLQIVLAGIGGLITLFLVPYLKQKSSVAKAEALMVDLDTGEMLLRQVKSFLFEEATIIAEQKFPKLAKKISSEGLKEGSIKKELESWGTELADRARFSFKTQGLDLVAAIGDDYLDRLIRAAADKVSPFPGRDTAAALLEKEWSNKLVAYGVRWVREKYLAEGCPKSEEGGE